MKPRDLLQENTGFKKNTLQDAGAMVEVENGDYVIRHPRDLVFI